MRDGIGASSATGLTFQERLGREIRRARGSITQVALGDMVGRPQSTVSMWETGRLPVSLDMLIGLEAALDMVPGTLLVAADYLDLDSLVDSVQVPLAAER
jgi:transcriptional regulator with XRE-family HTH domain